MQSIRRALVGLLQKMDDAYSELGKSQGGKMAIMYPDRIPE